MTTQYFNILREFIVQYVQLVALCQASSSAMCYIFDDQLMARTAKVYTRKRIVASKLAEGRVRQNVCVAAARQITKMHFKLAKSKRAKKAKGDRQQLGSSLATLLHIRPLSLSLFAPSLSYSLFHSLPLSLCCSVYLSNDFAKYAQKCQQQHRNMVPLNGL